MTFNYIEKLRSQLYSLQQTLGISDYVFEVETEQDFIKRKDLTPNTIYILVKFLQNDLQWGADTQPVQILILSEQNSLDIAQAFFKQFAATYNFNTHSESYYEGGVSKTLWVKQQYTDPVVLSNFNIVDYGYRSVLYLSATLYIMYNVVDLQTLKIDNNAVNVLTWNISYNMTPNTQQVTGSSEFISKSTKSVSSLAITITIPVVESALTEKVLKIINETDGQTASELTYGGNEDFTFDFFLGSTHFENKTLKLISFTHDTAIDNIPAIRLGFIK